MNTKSILSLWACALALSLPRLSEAHFLWVSLDPSAKIASAGLQEFPKQEPLPLGKRTANVHAWSLSGRPLSLKADANWLRATTAESCVGVSLDYGVIPRHDGGQGQLWLKYYAKGALTLTDSQSNLKLPVELSASPGQNGKVLVRVTQDGQPAPAAELVVEDSEGKTTFEGKTGADGTAALPQSNGPFEVRALVAENTPGDHDGMPYALIHSYSTLTVATPVVKSLTRRLSQSFGNMHEAATQTAFIQTVLTGAITKPQLETHLQQRALVHEAVDEILQNGHVDPDLYGPDEKQVLAFLREDLQLMGASWPAPSSALPPTKKFLRELKASAKQGPYFALGVFHVYFGGITNGGRELGVDMEDKLKVRLDYYEKSDGYMKYVGAVNRIPDPEAQTQMILGADEAYKYIIAINNLPLFKSPAVANK
jgi:hypothetical protein